MLYDNPCDQPGYYEREYSEQHQIYLDAKADYEIDNYEEGHFYDDDGQIFEVVWDTSS